MSSPLSRSLASNEAVAGPDDSIFSPVQIEPEARYHQRSRSASYSSEYDDIDDGMHTSDEETPLSAFYEVNASTHRYRNRKKKNDYKNSPKYVVNVHNKHLSRPTFNSDRRPQYHATRFIKRVRSVPNVVLPAERIFHDQYDELNSIIDRSHIHPPDMDQLVRNNPLASPPPSSESFSASEPTGMGVTNLVSTPLSPPTAIPSAHSPSRPPRDLTSPRLSETAEVTIYPSSVSLRGLLSYQDVMNAIEREFHLHEGQEREIIMKLWLKGQTMISILQRYRHLLQDLNLDDQDFLGGMKQIREMINFADRDVQHLREQTAMLESQNHFLEGEFHRQLDKVVLEKNEQINRLISIIDQTCASSIDHTGQIRHVVRSSGTSDILAQNYIHQNMELQRELETLRARLEYTFKLLNDKLDQHGGTSTVVQTALDQMRHSDAKLQELQWRSSSQQQENELLRYIMDKSQHSSSQQDVTQLFSIIEQRSLERELRRVRHELEITENKIVDLEQKFESSDETVKFNIDRLKVKCDALRQHISTCNRRLNEAMQQFPDALTDNNERPSHENLVRDQERQAAQLENDLFTVRQQYQELLEYSNKMKFDLEMARKQLHERSLFERDLFESNAAAQDSSELEQERRRATRLESELVELKIKHQDVCERVSTAALHLQRAKADLERTERRCEQLEKEKLRKKLLEINSKSELISQNVANVTAKYKDKMNTIKSRLAQTDRERRNAQYRMEQLQDEIERLKNELTHKKEVIHEKDKLIQNAQYKSREILLERQSVEEKISNEYKRLNELVDKNRLLEEELERIRRSQVLENITVRRTEVINLDGVTVESASRLEEWKSKIHEFERKFMMEKASKESLQVQIKILEEENTDLRDIMSQMRKRTHDDRREDRDRNDEIQLLIARAESNARQYMSNFNLSSSPTSTLVRLIPIS